LKKRSYEVILGKKITTKDEKKVINSTEVSIGVKNTKYGGESSETKNVSLNFFQM